MKTIVSTLCVLTLLLNLLCSNFLLAISEDFSSENNSKQNNAPGKNEHKNRNIFPIDNKYGWNSTSKWKEERKKLYSDLQIYKLYKKKKQSHFANCLKSVLAPGWGHFSAQSYTKGEVLLGLQIFLLGSTLYFYDKSMDNYDKYKTAHQIDEMHQYYGDANSSYRTSQIFFSLWAIVWGYAIFDAVQATENYNRTLWEKLKIEYKNKEISLTPKGISIEF